MTSASYADNGLAASTTYYYLVEAIDPDGASAASALAQATTQAGGGGGGEGPYGGTPAAVPGTVQAENYDTGGQGVGYNVTSVNGTANTYRSDGVDIEACTDTGGGYNVGWSAAGQWFRYSVNVATAGTYTVTFRVANGGTTSGTLHLQSSSGTNLTGSVTVPVTGGWQTWTNVTATVTLPAGQQMLTWSQDAGGFNVNYMSFALSGGGGGGTDIIAINCGGAAASPFVADTDFSGGTAATSTAAVTTSGLTNPAPQAVYLGNRWGAVTYTIGGLTAGAAYTVRLHFAETYWTAAGARKFNVSINGAQVLSNFDIFATAGGENIANIQQFSANANSSGQIVITSTNVTDNAQFNGIEIQGSATQSCSAVPPTGPTTLTATAASSSAISLNWATGFTNPPCTVTGYNVFRGATNGFAPSAGTMIANGVTSTTYTNSGLAASTTYYYLVETLDSFGASAASPQAQATTQAGGGGGEGPYGGTPAAVPGTVQAENYDTGGQGVGYNITTVNGTANTYRSDGVDIEACTDTGGGDNIGWSAAGQWFRYTVNVATAGTYTVTFRVANGNTTSGSFHLQNSSGTNLTGSVTIPATGGWQTWTNVTATVTLPAGQQVLTWSQDTGGYNLNYMSFASSGGGGSSEVIEIDCGGAAVSPFVADTDFSGGTAVTSAAAVTTSGVTNPAPMAVYQSNRYNAPSYTIGGLTAGALYTVRLHLAETYWTAAAKREFNVSINGTQVLTNFDIFATAGGENIANIQQFNTNANSSGQIVITATNVVDNAQFNGIEILTN